jgi:long-chain acyl-CoA synthetase
VFPEEIEQVMSRSPLIKEICVLGKTATKGLRKGCEEVFAVIVPNLDSFNTEERVDAQKIRGRISNEISRLAENLAEYKRIVDFEIWDKELPKTATKKIKRQILLEIINKGEN